MLAVLAIAFVLVALTVAIHAYGLSLILPMLAKSRAAPPTGHWPITWLLVRIAWFLILIHVLEITLWALLFWWERLLPTVEAAFYFSGVTYTTLGYGDLVLPVPWRIFAPLEALTGALMFGLSTGLFFAVVRHWIGNWMQQQTTSETRAAVPVST